MILVDTILYNPSVKVLSVDKINRKVVALDCFNDNKTLTLDLVQSKHFKSQYYFKLHRRSYWLHQLHDYDLIKL